MTRTYIKSFLESLFHPISWRPVIISGKLGAFNEMFVPAHLLKAFAIGEEVVHAVSLTVTLLFE